MAASGFIAGAVGSGSLKGAALGAFSAAAFHGLGGVSFGSDLAGVAIRSATYGSFGGVMGVLQGGRFGHGFLSAAATQVAAGRIDALEYERQRVIAAAALGGTVSAATGGKFANGAATAAFGRATSELQQRRRNSQRPAFKGQVSVNTDISVPGMAVAPSSPNAVTSSPGRDLGPPQSAATLARTPVGSTANIDYSATGGTDASPDRQQGLEGYLTGGISAQELRDHQIVYARDFVGSSGCGVGGHLRSCRCRCRFFIDLQYRQD